jgi:N-formylmaleamate deformylase
MSPHWTDHDVSVNGARLHYCRTGRGDKRPLVLVHGFSDNGLCWTPTARALESEYDVIMPDMRGHGLSARVRPDDAVDMAADLAELVLALELGRPIIVGHSMGAGVAYHLGVRFPELARGLALEDPPWWLSGPGPAQPGDRPAENPIITWAKDLPHHSLEQLLAGYRRDHPAWPEELLRPMCESKKQLDQAVVEILARKMRAPEESWQTTLNAIVQPLLIITGSPELGGIVTPEVVAKVRELNPRVTIIGVPNAGHLIRFDQPAAFMEALRGFLKQLPA